MDKLLCSDDTKREISEGLMHKIYAAFYDGVHFAMPMSSLRTNEADLVRSVLQALQGLSSSLIFWDPNGQTFCAKSGIYVSHLSYTSLHVLISQFMYAATCLRLVETAIGRIETSLSSPPTLRAFSTSVSAWLKRLRNVALKEEMKTINSDVGVTPTLLGLASSLSSICSGAEYLLQTVHGAIPQVCLERSSSISAAEIAVHILDYLYKKLDEVCLVQGGEEEAYQMLQYIFAGSLLPYIEALDSWLFEGTLDDPFEEMYFYANRLISVNEAEFWEKSYLFRWVHSQKSDLTSLNDEKGVSGYDSITSSISGKGKEEHAQEILVCPLFIKDICKSIVSAGKSLQLIQHIPSTPSATSAKSRCHELNALGNSDGGPLAMHGRCRRIANLSLSEIFCLTLAGLIGHGDHVSRYFWKGEMHEWGISPTLASYRPGEIDKVSDRPLPVSTGSVKIWYKFLVDAMQEKGMTDVKPGNCDACYSPDIKKEKTGVAAENALQVLSCPENLVVSVSKMTLQRNKNAWNMLNLSESYCLPPLNDECLWNAVYEGTSVAASGFRGTDYKCGFQFGQSEYLCSRDEMKMLEALFPFPTLLPSYQELRVSELLPFQKDSTLPSRILSWMLNIEPRDTPLPVVVMQECLTIYIRRQVDYVGKVILLKLMNDWRLMDELAVLRAIYLLGSGDLLQHFLAVIFNKLDKGETWDDDFELNTILQESIRNSADVMLLSSPDSLVVSIAKEGGLDGDKDDQANEVPLSSTPRKSRIHSFGIESLDSLKFTYKVSWPLELIANNESMKKYNQVMGFLLKVKRAKFVLDKVRRWMWKGRGSETRIHKHHWLLEQKLLSFVDAFHQYVMDRVYHTAWRELCEAMAKAGSLDEVIEVHETYLLSIQRQCFVVPEKLWAIISSRINMILGLALDFYSIQQTLSSGGAVSAIKARCEMEIDHIEKQFDDCIAFLLRVLSSKLNVGHFPHLADLVTRINYNYYYMSDTGNLMTVPGTETTSSRPWKAPILTKLK